jgi:hypothetical protein
MSSQIESTEFSPVKYPNGLTVTKSMTTPSKPGKKPREVWTVTGLTLNEYRDALYDLGGRPYPRSSKHNFNFWDDPNSDIAALNDSDKTSFAEQQEGMKKRAVARSERYEELAQKNSDKSNAYYQTSSDAVAGIPLGQPILIGHHSEGRHRRDIARCHSAMDKSVEHQKKSEHYEYKAAVAASNAESHGIEFIGNRIADCEAKIRACEKYPDTQFYIQQKKEEEEKLEYWKQKFDEAGGLRVEISKIKKGDYIKVRGQWYTVIRVNKKTVTHSWFYEGGEWKSPHHEIQEHKTVV